ncbi:MAG: hypothetical protein ACLPUO_12865 [Streptosporangiaceae bacterium]
MPCPKPSYLVLHRPSRLHFKSDSPLRWPKDYIKFCARDRGQPEEWAAIGGDVTMLPVPASASC